MELSRDFVPRDNRVKGDASSDFHQIRDQGMDVRANIAELKSRIGGLTSEK